MRFWQSLLEEIEELLHKPLYIIDDYTRIDLSPDTDFNFSYLLCGLAQATFASPNLRLLTTIRTRLRTPRGA